MNPQENEQAQRWNGVAGRAWVATQDLLDGVLKPIETLLVDAVVARGPRRVLDVGCGTGATTVGIAKALGPEAQCLGADISEPMIEGARARASRDGSAATFVVGNAQTYAFAPASFDMIVSRFGVMFFDDAVAAFRNLRRAATGGGEMRLVTWRSAEDNPFMTVAETAAAALLPIPPRVADAPGQFGLANPDLVRRILGESGWSDIELQAEDIACSFSEKDLVDYFTRLGPVGLVFGDADETTRERVIEAVRPAFEPYVHGSQVRFDAACWMVSARVR